MGSVRVAIIGVGNCASALVQGATIAEYAETARVTEGTARQQLKHLMARTGTRRQAELVRVLLGSVAQLLATPIERGGR